MEEKLLAAKQMLQKYGQEHLLNSFNSLSNKKQRSEERRVGKEC